MFPSSSFRQNDMTLILCLLIFLNKVAENSFVLLKPGWALKVKGNEELLSSNVTIDPSTQFLLKHTLRILVLFEGFSLEYVPVGLFFCVKPKTSF